MEFAEEILDFEPEEKQLVDASSKKRFINHLIDQVMVMVIAFIIGVCIALYNITSGTYVESDESTFFNYLLGWVIAFVYFLVLENATKGKTIGKFITKTRVVTEDGETPTFKNLIGRTLCRSIPFDAFSFLGEKPGWHDSISKTRVVLD